MSMPGTQNAQEAEMLDRADKEAESLLDELKSKVRVDVKDIGPLRKELVVTVPADVIGSRLKHNYSDLRSDALLPGFRKGKAPLHLIEKRFGAEVRDSLRTMMVGQSFFAAASVKELEVLGDPLFRVTTKEGEKLAELNEALPHIKLNTGEELCYKCEVEVKPKFELPELAGIEIKSPTVDVGPSMVEDVIARQRKIRGRYEMVGDSAGDADDIVIADVKLTCDGALVKEEANLQLGIRPTRLDGIPLPELDKTLQGAKPGEQRLAEADIPDDYERADLRGKKCKFEFQIHEVKRLIPLTMAELVEQSGHESEADMRSHVEQDMLNERDRLIERAKREQVLEHLLKSVSIEIPPDLSARQTDRAVMRKVIDLQQNGTPWGEIEASIDALRTSATEEVIRNLKLEFILERVAKAREVKVTVEEVNSEIARIARLYDRRFDRVRDDLQSRGLLPQLAEQLRQDKCVELILKDAKLVN